MVQKISFIFLASLLLSSCSMNPPAWLRGQWKQNSDSLNQSPIVSTWHIRRHSILHKTNKTENVEIQSNELLTVSEIKEPNRYIIRTEHKAEKLPYFQVFKRLSDDKILYYDSTALMPRQEYTLTRMND